MYNAIKRALHKALGGDHWCEFASDEYSPSSQKFANKINNLKTTDDESKETGKVTEPDPDFSPNNIRTLIITKDYILVRYHIPKKPCFTKQVNNYPTGNKLDIYGYLTDRQSNYSLNRLLNKRVLGGMEEFYVDQFCIDAGLIDLKGFLDKLIGCDTSNLVENPESRLRYAGVISNPDSDGKNLENYLIQRTGWTRVLAEDASMVSSYGVQVCYENNYNKVNNSFVKYRGHAAQHYKLDGPDGALTAYFNKVIARAAAYPMAPVLKSCMIFDMEDVGYLEEFDRLYKLIEENKSEGYAEEVLKALKAALSAKSFYLTGYIKDDIRDAVQSAVIGKVYLNSEETANLKAEDKEHAEKLYNLYIKYLFKSSREPVNEELLVRFYKNNTGLFNIDDLLSQCIINLLDFKYRKKIDRNKLLTDLPKMGITDKLQTIENLFKILPNNSVKKVSDSVKNSELDAVSVVQSDLEQNTVSELYRKEEEIVSQSEDSEKDAAPQFEETPEMKRYRRLMRVLGVTE